MIAAVKNDLCGVGIAYDAKVASLRVISSDGDIVEAHEAKALHHKMDAISIYTTGYGAGAADTTIDDPGYVIKKALLKGVSEGRPNGHGKGNIYVIPTGNGGAEGDECNYDGFVNRCVAWHSILPRLPSSIVPAYTRLVSVR